MPPVRQSSFGGGQLAPEMWGQTDLPKYREAVRLGKNVLVTPQRGLKNRAGFQYLGVTKNQSVGTAQGGPNGSIFTKERVRLIPFQYSDAQQYILEFGCSFTGSGSYMRVWNQGALVESSPGVPFEISPTGLSDPATLRNINYAQVGDVMYLTHPSVAPLKLVRNSNANWSLTSPTFATRPSGFTLAAYPPELRTPPAADFNHPFKDWQWQVTAIMQDGNGLIFETGPWTITRQFSGGYPAARTYGGYGGRCVVYPDRYVVIDWIGAKQTAPVTAYTVIGYRVYKGRGLLMGLIGETKPGFEYFEDFGYEPDYALPPPLGQNPFYTYTTNGSGDQVLAATAVPTAVAFYEQRLCVAGAQDPLNNLAPKPSTFWGSKTDDYENFDSALPPLPDSSIEFALASRKREQILWLTGLEDLLVGTNSSVWRVSGGQAPLEAANVQARVQSEVGANYLRPIVESDVVLYGRNLGDGVQSLAFDEGRGAYAGRDLNVLSSDLFETDPPKDWTFCRTPFKTLWVCTEAGRLVSMCFVPELDLWGWTAHETDGFVEAVASIREGREDKLYISVRRTVGGVEKRFIERLNSRTVQNVADGNFLDCSLSYSGAPVTAVSGLTHLEGREVHALADGQWLGPFTVTGGSITLPLDVGASIIHVGLRVNADIEFLDVPLERHKYKTVPRVVVEVERGLGMKVGESFTRLVDVKFRSLADSYNAVGLKTGAVQVDIKNSWNTGGRVCIRQEAPLPLHVLAITREVEPGER